MRISYISKNIYIYVSLLWKSYSWKEFSYEGLIWKVVAALLFTAVCKRWCEFQSIYIFSCSNEQFNAFSINIFFISPKIIPLVESEAWNWSMCTYGVDAWSFQSPFRRTLRLQVSACSQIGSFAGTFSSPLFFLFTCFMLICCKPLWAGVSIVYLAGAYLVLNVLILDDTIWLFVDAGLTSLFIWVYIGAWEIQWSKWIGRHDWIWIIFDS